MTARMTDPTPPEDQRSSSRLRRVMWALLHPGRMARFRRWRKSPAITTRGYLAFRDMIVVGLVVAIVWSGVATVRSLRAEDCRSANDRRAEVEEIALFLLDNDENFLTFTNDSFPDVLPEAFVRTLLDRYELQRGTIHKTYAPTDCPGDDLS